MPEVSTTAVESGLALHRVELEGTRAVTILLAFDAGARSEHAEENGMAHFLEHLVFKGGEKFPGYRDINETAERLGGVLNAYTSHDLVAFHITCRAEVVNEAMDLLTDFVGRPRLDPGELDRERGVVIQEIARAYDQPSTVAEMLIDRAAFGEHPLGRPVLGPEDHLRSFQRDAILAFRQRRWAAERSGAFIVGNLDHLDADEQLNERLARLPRDGAAPPYEPAPPFEPRSLVERRDSKQSHLRMSYRPTIDPRDERQRAALTIYSTLLGGSMGSRLFDEIREQRGLAYSVGAGEHVYADTSVLQIGAGLESANCVEAYSRMREIVRELRDDGPTEGEVERARALAAGRRVLAFENTGAVARYAAHTAIVYDEPIDPDRAITLLDEVTFDEVGAIARGVVDELALACVGPHDVEDFE